MNFSTLKYCPADPPTSFSGHATYYTLCCTFACSYASQAIGQYYCAASSAGANNLWSSSGSCGACIQANYAAGGTSVIVQVVDSCPTCSGPDDLDLSQTAFSALANTSLGNISITWHFVECPLSILNANASSGGKVTYFYKDGETSGIFFEDYLFPIISVVTGKGESLTHSADNRWQSSSGYFGYSANAVMPVTITDARGNKLNASVTLTTGTGSCAGALNPCYSSVIAGGAYASTGQQFPGCVAAPTNTPTNSPTKTNTPTTTATFTPTKTHTPTASMTPSFTPTSTATRTHSPTSTATGTPSATPTRTASATGTSTPTNTGTSTFTRTSTPSGTPTSTVTSTPSRTPMATASSTSTFTPTRTNTASATPTATGANTATFTSTATVSMTPTATPTATPSATPTRTASPTVSSTPTATGANTATFTSTPTNTASRTPTASATYTGTSTPSSTNTPSSTATPTGANSATFTSTPTRTATGTATASATSTLSATASMTPTASLTATPSATPTKSSTFTATFTSTPTATNANTATPTSTSTWTGTFTWTATPTRTFTATPTATFTGTFTFTATPTDTPTTTFTPTKTFTPTPTVGREGRPILYPNPATGPTVALYPPYFSGAKDMKIQVFTSAFRKVREDDHPNPMPGVAVTLELKDRMGVPLADGLYYVLCDLDGRRTLAKLLILR